MSRRKKSKKRIILQDSIYNSVLVSMMINKILLDGKKSIAQNILYEVLKNIKISLNQDPIEILKKAVTNATPIVEIKSRRIGGATYQVPIEVKKRKRKQFSTKIHN